MKKLIYILSVLFFSFTLAAKPVSQQKAETVALRFLGLQYETKGTNPLRLIWTGGPTTKVGSGDPAFYVFEKDGGGFIIVSGDDCLRPILAYSDDSDFIVENMPEHIEWWFSSISETVMQVRKKGLKQSDAASNEWKSTAKRSSPKVELKTALWWQSYPYNMFMPMIKNEGKDHCVTGCGTTATAIVMRYHEYPEAGSGTLPDYSYDSWNPDWGEYSRSQSGHTLGHRYDWKNMPTTHLNESTPLYQAQQVAQLMYDCAIMNQAHMTPNGTGTDMKRIPFALVTYMGYDKSIRHLKRAYYSPRYSSQYEPDAVSVRFESDEWERMIREELDAGRPVIYSGNTAYTRAHAWVIEGYDDDGFFKMNLGYGGAGNGYYIITFIIDETDITLLESHEMIIGIKPDEGGEWNSPPPCVVGRSTSNWHFDLNRGFTTCFTIRNDSYLDISVKYRIALTNKNGKLKYYLSTSAKTVTISANLTETVQSSFAFSSMPDIDDQIMLFYEENGKWKPMNHNDEGIIKMKGPSAIEDCTSFSYSKDSKVFTISSEKDNAIQIYYTDSNGGSFLMFSQQNSGAMRIDTNRIPSSIREGISPYDLTVRVFNISESKEFRIKLKD